MKSNFPLIHHVNKKRAQQNIVPIAQGIKYTKKYREILRRNSDKLKQIFDLPHAESFDRNAIELLLKQKGAESVRIYYGVDDNNQVRLVLVAVDKHGKDIIVPLLKIKRTDKQSNALSAQDTTAEEEEEDVTEQDEADENASAEMSAERAPEDGSVDEDAQVVNSGQRCPHVCDETSVLNADISNE